MASWQKPITSKKYLQAPLSGYFYTQWPDFKVLGARFETASVPPKGTWSKYPAVGFRLLKGEEMESFPFLEGHMSRRDDGCPIHSVETDFDGLHLELESFCNTDTPYSTAFSRVRLTNRSAAEKRDVIGLIVRSGAENYLTGMEVDGYVSYNSNVANWGFLQPTWQWDGADRLTDGEFTLLLRENHGFALKWQGAENGLTWHQRHLLRLEYALAPDETAELELLLRPNCAQDVRGTYEAEREACGAFWAKQLTHIKNDPAPEEYRPIVNNMVCQSLQFFANYLEEGFIAPRQGGMNRLFWAAEAVEFLTALDRLGDFKEYTSTACDFFFNHCQIKEGENAGEVILRTAWAASTGAAIRATAYHATHTDRAEFDAYRDAMYLGFQWMERQRAISYRQDCEGKGIFPAKKGTDWPGEFQSWCVTDGHNLTGYRELAKAFRMYGDPKADEVEAAYHDYLRCEREILAREVAKNPAKDELLLTNRLGHEQTDPPVGPYFGDGPSMLLFGGVMDPNSPECALAEQYFRNRGCMKNGLTGLMSDGLMRPSRPADPWAGHMWYLSSCDSRWFHAWLEQGNREKAFETIRASLRYGMSEEYYIPERIADNDPTWAPWQPNASANGRLLHMLMDYYGEMETTFPKLSQ